MRKPNSFSVTRIPCSCGTLRFCAEDPKFPIRFDPELNEYSFEHSLGRNKKSSMIIYHCPMCGGVASESRRSALHARMSKKEAMRLRATTEGSTSLEDIENALGGYLGSEYDFPSTGQRPCSGRKARQPAWVKQASELPGERM